jgi:hypothetical protein
MHYQYMSKVVQPEPVLASAGAHVSKPNYASFLGEESFWMVLVVVVVFVLMTMTSPVRLQSKNLAAAAAAAAAADDDSTTTRMIDIAASFAPTGVAVLLWKAIATVWIASVILIGICSNVRQGLIGGYLTFFSNWGTIASFFYMSTSFINSAAATMTTKKWDMVRLPDNNNNNEKRSYPNLWTRFTWALFAITAHSELSITLIFWNYILFVDSTPGWIQTDLSPFLRRYQDVMTHGVVAMLVFTDGLVVNRIPLRLAHGWQFVIWFYLLYLIWIPINARLMSRPVFYRKFMTRDMSGRLAPIQDPSPRFIYAAFALHVMTVALILCFGVVVYRRNSHRKQLPAWLVSFGKLALCCDLFALVWPAVYVLFGKHLEYCLGKGVIGFLILFFWCPIIQIILFVLSGLSRRRYLPVNVLNEVDSKGEESSRHQ